MFLILILLDKHTEHQIWVLSINMELKHILLKPLTAFFALEPFLSARFHMNINITLLNSQSATLRTVDLEIVDEFFKFLVGLEVPR